jgi:hypothetical protein
MLRLELGVGTRGAAFLEEVAKPDARGPLTQDQRDTLCAASSVLLDWADLLGGAVAEAAEELYAAAREARRAHADLGVREAARRVLQAAERQRV